MIEYLSMGNKFIRFKPEHLPSDLDVEVDVPEGLEPDEYMMKAMQLAVILESGFLITDDGDYVFFRGEIPPPYWGIRI